MKRSTFIIGLFVMIGLMVPLSGWRAKGLAKPNSKLAEKVQEAIANYYQENIDVIDMGNGKIRLEGKVRTLYDKLRIYAIVSKVPGVKIIKNNIVVDTPPIPDKIIEANIRYELKLNESILEPERIQVKVHNGIVFLSGEVSFQREKEMAATIASWQKGVRGIVNNITVLPPEKAISDENLKIIIQHILHDQFPLEKSVSFTVKDGVVTLTGNCSTLWVKEEIPRRLLRIRGIRKVINKLNVVPME